MGARRLVAVAVEEEGPHYHLYRRWEVEVEAEAEEGLHYHLCRRWEVEVEVAALEDRAKVAFAMKLEALALPGAEEV